MLSSDPTADILAEVARVIRERDEAVALAARLDRECRDLSGELDAANAHGRRMAKARDELDTECVTLRVHVKELQRMVERAHAAE